MGIFALVNQKYRFLKITKGTSQTARLAKKKIVPGKPTRVTHLDNILIGQIRRGAVVTFTDDSGNQAMGVVVQRIRQVFLVAVRDNPKVYAFELLSGGSWKEYRSGKMALALKRRIDRMRDANLKNLFERLQKLRQDWKFKTSEFEATAHELARAQNLLPYQLKRFYQFLHLLKKTYEFPI